MSLVTTARCACGWTAPPGDWTAMDPRGGEACAGRASGRDRDGGTLMPIRPENRERYPDNWPTISAWVRFTRALGHCECEGECGRGTHEGRCPNRQGQPAYGTGSKVVLTTAHLDHTPENCDPANLRAMCQGCHLHYDRDHHAQTRSATRARELAAVMDPLPGLGELA